MGWWAHLLQYFSDAVRAIRARRAVNLISLSGAFQADWYLTQYPDVRAAGVDPVAHYLRCGAKEGRDPNPFFYTGWYLAENPDVRASGINPLVHYLLHGAANGRDPSPLFNTVWYLAENPDVRKAGVNPLAHYLICGRYERRNPRPPTSVSGVSASPVDESQAEQARRLIVSSGAFQADWYLTQYPDVAASSVDPVAHYVECGAEAGHDPNPLFDSDWYISENPDVRTEGINPLAHYLLHGAANGRDPSPLFDTDWYLAANPDVREAGINPLVHYIKYGERERRKPRPPTRRPSLRSGSRTPTNRPASPVLRSVPRAVEVKNSAKRTLPGFLTAHPEISPERGQPLNRALSVVIPTYNAGTEFYWLVKKLKRQKGLRSVEIVVVDSGSDDGTDTVAHQLGCKVVRISKEQFSHSYSRNLGAEHATGDLLMFMVQDAYPVGDFWLYGLASCLLNTEKENELAALSCAEYIRSDSDVLYEYLADTHYHFLRCRDQDRVGSFCGADHVSLREQGQLSDIACLIPRALFEQYKYQGRYAEDLRLGVRLIRDGHKVGMLSSIPVIHSHRRSTGYYLRRVFVDVIFLAELFPDCVNPQLKSVRGSLAAGFALRMALAKLAASGDTAPGEALASVIRGLQQLQFPANVADLSIRHDFGFAPFGAWIDRVAVSSARAHIRPAESAIHLKSAYLFRLASLESYVGRAYAALDAVIAAELNDAIEKTLAMTLGAQLAYHYVAVKSGSTTDIDAALVLELGELLSRGI